MGNQGKNPENIDPASRQRWPNMLIIAGDGRNSGKTFLACQIIKQLSLKHEVTGIKISPHFHEQPKEAIPLFQEEGFMIFEEKALNTKDSSRMLQAGAKNVFFIMAEDDKLGEAFHQISEQMHNKAVVIESGGLIRIIEPGMFLFLKKDHTIRKKEYLAFDPFLLYNLDPDHSFDPERIVFSGGKMKLMK